MQNADFDRVLGAGRDGCNAEGETGSGTEPSAVRRSSDRTREYVHWSSSEIDAKERADWRFRTGRPQTSCQAAGTHNALVLQTDWRQRGLARRLDYCGRRINGRDAYNLIHGPGSPRQIPCLWSCVTVMHTARDCVWPPKTAISCRRRSIVRKNADRR